MIAIDVGQSGSRASINGELITLDRGKRAGEPIISALREIAVLLPKAEAEVASLSLTGLFGIVANEEHFQNLCNEFWGVQRTVVIDDGLASYFGAVGGDDGVALTLGGGVVAVAGCNGAFAHTDGLGSTFGDEGSGYWLGSRALTRALATRDQRDNERELLAFLAPEVDAFDALTVKNSSDAAILAIKSARKLLDAADHGLEIALEIRREGARRLGATVTGAWSKAGGQINQSPVIAISGGLSANKSYVDDIFGYITQVIPDAKLIAPRGGNLDGAIWIAENLQHDIPPLMKWAKGKI